MEKPGNRKQEKTRVRDVKGKSAAATAPMQSPNKEKRRDQTIAEGVSEGEGMKELLVESEHKLKMLRSKADLKTVALAKPFLPVDPNASNSRRHKAIADLYRVAEVQFGTVETHVWADRVDSSGIPERENGVDPLIPFYYPDLLGIGAHTDNMMNAELNLPNNLDFDAFGAGGATKEIIEVTTIVGEIDEDWMIVRKTSRPTNAKAQVS